MKMRNTILLLLAALLLTLTSCERRELEIYYPETVRLRLDIDWTTKYGSLPTGTTLLFSKDGDVVTQSMLSNSVKTVYVDLKPGTYGLLLFNQSKDEFGTFYFDQMDSHTNAFVHALNVSAQTRGVWDEGITYVYDPERLGAATDTIVITEAMLEEQVTFANYESGERTVEVADTSLYIYKEVVTPRTTYLNVRARVRGFNNMAAVRSYVTGLSTGCSLSQVWRNADPGTLSLSSWTAVKDTLNDGEGWIYTRIPTFGFLSGKEYTAQRDSADNVIKFNFTLRDGTEKAFVFNAGKLIHYIGHEPGAILTQSDVVQELELVLDLPYIADEEVIVLPDVEYSEKAGGFDAIVEPWEDGGTINIGL